MLRPLAILFGLGILISSGAAVGQPSARDTIYSQSGQFVIAGKRMAPTSAVVYGVDTNWNSLVPVGRQPGARTFSPDPVAEQSDENPIVTLGPSYLAASAERIRQLIYDQLELPDVHRGTVFITLLRPTNPPQEIFVMHMRNKGTWDYKLEIPEEVRADHLLRALTYVILMELANRDGRPELVEIPLWLREGMIEHLRITVMKSVFFRPEERVSVVGRLNDEVAHLKRELRGESPLGLEQLSWPGTLKSGPSTERLYRLTSHAMVTELLQLPSGERQLGEMILLLPQYQNWQFAFLRAFRNSFSTLLDVEKWWAVASSSLSGVQAKPQTLEEQKNTASDLVFRTELDLDRWQRVTARYLGAPGANVEWSFGETYLQLGEILVVPVERQEEEDGEIFREEISVPDLLTSMAFSLQKPVIEGLVARLFGLQLHAPSGLESLVRDYRFTLEKYLVDVEETYAVKRGKFSPNISPVVVTRRTLQKLQELDERRENIGTMFQDDIPEKPGQVAASESVGSLP